jgi:hypothetical protein
MVHCPTFFFVFSSSWKPSYSIDWSSFAIDLTTSAGVHVLHFSGATCLAVGNSTPMCARVFVVDSVLPGFVLVMSKTEHTLHLNCKICQSVIVNPCIEFRADRPYLQMTRLHANSGGIECSGGIRRCENADEDEHSFGRPTMRVNIYRENPSNMNTPWISL